MNIGLLLPGFSAHAEDHALPVQDALVEILSRIDDVRVIPLRYPHHQQPYELFGAQVFPLGAGQTRGLGRLKLWRNALTHIERQHCARPFDVLHAMWADETGLIAAWAGRRLKIPVVVSVLGGELARLDAIHYGHQRGRFSRWIVREALTGASKILLAGESAKEQLRRCGLGSVLDHCIVVPLGVDTTRFSQQEATRDPLKLLSVASLVPVKNHALLLNALALTQMPATLDLIGTGSEQTGLETLCDQLNLRERVRFLGAIPHIELPAHYRRAGLHVLASRSEALALAVLEAAACGTFNLCTAVGALPDYPTVTDTVPSENASALASRIDALLSESAALRQRAAQAAVFTQDQLSISQTASRLRHVYEQLTKA